MEHRKYEFTDEQLKQLESIGLTAEEATIKLNDYFLTAEQMSISFEDGLRCLQRNIYADSEEK